MLGTLPKFASKYLPGPVHEFCFSHSKSPISNICKVHLLPKASDNGPQFPHLSKDGLDLKCLASLALNMLSFSWRFISNIIPIENTCKSTICEFAICFQQNDYTYFPTE